MTSAADPRAVSRGADRWLTDSRVYNLVWLGRWIERAQTIARVVRWAAMQDDSAIERGGQHDIETVLRMAADIRGLSVGPDETALDLLLMRDSGASLRGCLVAARFNSTHVAPVEVMQVLGEAVEMVDAGGDAIDSADGVIGPDGSRSARPGPAALGHRGILVPLGAPFGGGGLPPLRATAVTFLVCGLSGRPVSNTGVLTG